MSHQLKKNVRLAFASAIMLSLVTASWIVSAQEEPPPRPSDEKNDGKRPPRPSDENGKPPRKDGKKGEGLQK